MGGGGFGTLVRRGEEEVPGLAVVAGVAAE